MSSIHPATISLQPTSHASALKEVSSPPVLSAGEVLTAVVSEKLGRGKFLLALKDVAVSADSAIPLTAGEKLTVRVEQLQPRIVLSVIANETAEAAIISDCLKMQRANPDSLLVLIREAGELLDPENIGALPHSATGREPGRILAFLDRIILSPGNLKEPLFLKDFVSLLGLLWESDLKKLLKDPAREPGISRSGDTVKSLLMKLSADLRRLKGENVSVDSETARSLDRLAAFADRSVKSIEIQQVVNILTQESGGAYMLQIPFASSDGIRKADVFFECEDKKSGEGREARYAVVIFLSMEALGDLMIEARVSAESIGCVIKCDNDAVRAFITASAGELETKLLSLGYKTGHVRCLAAADLLQMKYEYVKDHGIYGQDVVDYFA